MHPSDGMPLGGVRTAKHVTVFVMAENTTLNRRTVLFFIPMAPARMKRSQAQPPKTNAGTLKSCWVAATRPLIWRLKPPSVSRYCGSHVL